MDGFVVSREVLNEELLKLTDWYTDEIFNYGSGISIKADFSRIFCDVERFVDDSKEVMAKSGMGVLYEKLDSGLEMRKVTFGLRKRILDNFYYIHHRRFEKAVNDILLKEGKCLIVDCHSFPDMPLKRDLSKKTPRPDFNIGTDPYHTPEQLTRKTVSYFEKRKYSVGIDWPFEGTIVPMTYYSRNPLVRSIMIEINRKLYLEDQNIKNETDFRSICNLIQDYFRELSLGKFQDD